MSEINEEKPAEEVKMVQVNTNEAVENGAESNETKKVIRLKVWDHMEKNGISSFPRPVHYRIPNFKGCVDAATKLLELEAFKTSQFIEVNPDKPQGPVRMLVLEQGKSLYVPVVRLKEGFLKHITKPENATKSAIQQTVSLRGLEENGKLIGITDEVKIDLLVVGSVAVSKLGQRIGKGKGYADLEFAILKEIKSVDDQTAIVTVVHDCQVFEEFPKDLFQAFDIPVDYIVTPTTIITVENKLPRPSGLIWNLLSQRRLDLMPILQTLKEKLEKEGVDTTLKKNSETEETDGFPVVYKRRNSRLRGGPPLISSSQRNSEENKENEGTDTGVQRNRFFKKTRVFRSKDRQEKKTNQGAETEKKIKPNKPKKRLLRRTSIDFSIMISNIQKTVRIRELKNALNDSGIKPNEIIWRGYKGFCYLHYAKPNGKRADLVESHQMDKVIETLKNLKIKPDSDSYLEVTVMDRISRIETTDVTAV